MTDIAVTSYLEKTMSKCSYPAHATTSYAKEHGCLLAPPWLRRLYLPKSQVYKIIPNDPLHIWYKILS
jgi:hypothetical protein